MFLIFGNLDFSTIFSITPIIYSDFITIICLLLLIGAMAKSAQMPLHTWLPIAIYFSLSKRKSVYANPNSGYTLKPHILNLK